MYLWRYIVDADRRMSVNDAGVINSVGNVYQRRLSESAVTKHLYISTFTRLHAVDLDNTTRQLFDNVQSIQRVVTALDSS